VYTPSAVVTVVALQFDDVNGDAVEVGHNRTLDATSDVPSPAESFDAGVYV
jgi:hypothetical protein